MTRIKRPYRTVDPRKPAGPGGEQPLGFVRTVQAKVAQLKLEVDSLFDRLRYKYGEGTPTAFVGERVFHPEDATLTVELPRIDQAGTATVQYVVRDSQTHSVPIVMPSPGVFMARFIKLEIYQRVFGGNVVDTGANGSRTNLQNQETKIAIPQSKPFMNPGILTALVQPPQTGKIHLLSGLFVSELGGDRNQIGVNFFWNLIDRDSERRLSDDLIPGRALLGQGFQAQVDGDLCEFDVPWLFERGGRVDFDFQLINPIFQLAPTDPTFPLVLPTGGAGTPWDDRENNGTVRDQAVTFRVELHGTRFQSERDLLLREAT